MGRCQILLTNEISIFKKLVSRREHEVLQTFSVNGCSDVGFQKTQWTNISRWHCTQIITDCGNLTLNIKQLELWASPPFFQTLEPWFPNEIQNVLSSEKRTLDHWATVQFFFSLAQVRAKTTTVAKFIDTSVCGGSWCLDPSLSSFFVKFTQILESILLDNPHKAAVLSVGCASFSSYVTFDTEVSKLMSKKGNIEALYQSLIHFAKSIHDLWRPKLHLPENHMTYYFSMVQTKRTSPHFMGIIHLISWVNIDRLQI